MVEKEPSRDTAFGAFSAFDDKSEGTLGLGEINGIFCCLGEPLKADEVSALMCEINHLATNGKVSIEELMNFLYGKEPVHIKDNDEALGVGQLTHQSKLK